nr:BrnT family toxin [Chromatium okenii]
MTYDETKRQTNLAKHGIDLADVGSVFDGFMNTVEDARFAYHEQRLQSLGWFRDRVVFLVWTDREIGPHVISCRYGTRHETQQYFQACL